MKPHAGKAGELSREGRHAVVPSSMMAGGTLKLATRTSGDGGGGGTEKEND